MPNKPRVRIEIKVIDDRPNQVDISLAVDMPASDVDNRRADVVERMLALANLGLHSVMHEKLTEGKIVD
jgi:hypothetical protein